MLGLMQHHPLLVGSVIDYAARTFGEVEVVSRSIEGPITRSTYADIALRTRKLAQALIRLGIKPGDRVGGASWNHDRYLEAFYGVSGMGAVLHTTNPRLFPEQMAYTISHAGDRAMLVDLDCLKAMEAIAGELSQVEAFIVLTDAANMPDTRLPNALAYEDLLAGEDGDYDWPDLDEQSASAICYTSGTTGDPKGVVYSHRSTILHAMANAAPNAGNYSYRDTIMPVVALFHGNGWGMPFVAPMTGAKLVLPGRVMEMPALRELILDEGVTIALGVPTIWLSMLEYLKTAGGGLGALKRIVTGGSAPPAAMIEALERDHGIETVHAWGMTETQAASTFAMPVDAPPSDETMAARLTQGRPLFGHTIRITDEAGAELPRDAAAVGELKVRGHWVASAYYRRDDAPALDVDGWLITGDVATISGRDELRLTDRAKDVIKSGGEWISSIDLENAAVGHPAIAEAAVIGIPHPKWQERPALIVVRAEGGQIEGAALIDWLADHVAKWWLPDEVMFVDEIPHTRTGKIDKVRLRQHYAEAKDAAAQ
ncbi:MAG TPA: long-chain fatty acid--CoA ligase [Alphaproteobacteria bacterium]|nr:long-chain fatty acid--CoA ligase [Alphaproteobacteria bacterium]